MNKLFAACFAAALAVFGLCEGAAAQAQRVGVCLESVGTDGSNRCSDIASTNPFPVFPVPSSGTAAGISAVVSGSAESSHVLKATPGNLYSVYATNLTATAGFLVMLNATTAPVDGAITPLDCVPLPGNTTASINYRPGPPEVFSVGVVAVMTSANTCFTKTTGVITGFIHGDAQ